MTASRIRLIAVAAAAALAGANMLASGVLLPAKATPSFTFSRVFGPTRYETASDIATENFAAAPTVVAASGANFPDALSGADLAGALGAPILLLPPSGPIPQAVLNALDALRTKTVDLLGGPAAVGDDVAAQLRSTHSSSLQGGNIDVNRIFGPTRYDTNLAVVHEAAARAAVGTFNNKKTAVVASGANFPDALAAGAVSFAKSLPIIITDPTTLSPQARQGLSDEGIQQVVIMGGTAAVSAADEATINAMGISTLVRMNGIDRSDTSAKNATYAIANLGFRSTNIDVASGDQFYGGADALASAPAGGKSSTALLVTQSVSDPGADVDFAKANQSTLASGIAFGGPNPLPDSTLASIQAAATGVTPNQTYTVTPSAAQTKTVSSLTNPTGGAVSYTATGLGTTVVDVQLFSASNVTQTDGQVTFTPAGSTNNADPGTVNATITTVNGTPRMGGSSATNVTPQNGQVTFTVNSSSPESDIPVVFSRADGNDTLELDANRKPTEPFGVGGKVTWVPPPGAQGAIAPASVTGVDKADSLFVLSTTYPGSDQARTYTWKSSDTFQLYLPASTSFPTPPGSGTCTNTNEGDWVNRLSLGDAMEGTFSMTGASVFCLDDIAPTPPSSIAVSAPPTNADTTATVTLGDSSTPSVASYNIYRGNKTGTSCATSLGSSTLGGLGFVKVGNVADPDPNAATSSTTTFTDTGLSPSTTYCYAATSVDQGGEESPNAVFGTAGGYTTAPAAVPMAPSSVSTGTALVAGHTTLGSGDKLVVNFDAPVTVAATYSMALADQSANTTSIDQTNSSSSVSLTNGGATATFTLTATPTSYPSPVALTKLEITSASGILGSAGAWNLAKSGTVKGAGSSSSLTFSRVFFGTNADLSPAPAITLVSVTATGSNPANTVTVTCSVGQNVRVYNSATGARIGGPTACPGSSLSIKPSPPLTSGEGVIATASPVTGAQESASAWPPMAVSAAGNSAATPANTITVTFGQDVTCTVSATSPGQFVFTPAGGGAPVTATSNTCGPGSTITLGFPSPPGLPANNSGVLTYTPDGNAPDNLKGASSAFSAGVAVPTQNLSAPIGT